MGEDKALIEFAGAPLIERISSLFSELFEEVIIVTNRKEFYKTFKTHLYSDLLPDKGPLGGLYTGISFSSFHYSFCVACDMPFIKKALVQYLIENISNEDVIIPRTRDGLQPLHAVYSKYCLGPIRKTLDLDGYRISDFYNAVNTKIIDEKYFLDLDPLRESFININSKEELQDLLHRPITN